VLNRQQQLPATTAPVAACERFQRQLLWQR